MIFARGPGGRLDSLSATDLDGVPRLDHYLALEARQTEQSVARSNRDVADMLSDPVGARRFYTYAAIPAYEVPVDTRRAAGRTFARACADLGLSGVELVWCVHAPHATGRVVAHHEAILGKHLPDEREVWVVADQDPDEAAYTVAHELRHLAQQDVPRELMEQDADQYADRLMNGR